MAIKRVLGSTVLACGCALLLACGGGSKKKAAMGGDGGEPDATSPIITPQTDLKGVNDNISMLGDRTTAVEKNIKDLQTGVDTANMDVSDLAKRVKALESPSMSSCSTSTNAGTCIPDGLSLAQMGIDALVKKLCAYEVGCCSADELNFKFGPAIKTADDCVSTFENLVNNGLTPNFLTDNAAVIQNIVLIAQAFNNPNVRIEIDSKAVDACVAQLDGRACAKYVAPTTATPGEITHCTASDTTSETDPCTLQQLINGLAMEGEPCGIVSPPSPGTTIPECADGLVCRAVGGSTAARGICAKPTKAGDRCTAATDCDRSASLFCNFSSGMCQAMAALGEDCAYVDPNFTSGAMSPLTQSIECLPELQCDPTMKKCVKLCSDGALCNFDSKGADCPDGMVCNFTEVPALYQQPAPAPTYHLGVCRTATAKGDPCTDNSECASGNCTGSIASSKTCGDPLKKPGDACDAAGPDDTCDSSYCGTDMKCTDRCGYDPLTDVPIPCAAGYFCDESKLITGTSQYACWPLLADTTTCGTNLTDPSNPHSTCASGFCKPGTATGTCTAKAAMNASCSDYRLDQECAAGQYCNTSNTTCTNVTAAGGTCTGPGDPQCGLGNFCDLVGSAYKCVTPAIAEGDACTPSTNACKAPLHCASDNKCHADGKYPDGVACTGDDQCMSGWCSGDGSTNPFNCKTPLSDGDDCDTVFGSHQADKTKNRCGATSYCKNPPDASAGKCTPKQSVGQACEQRFGGEDCLNQSEPTAAGACILNNGTYVCNMNALPMDQVMCHGT